MKQNDTEAKELLPCPFCGGEKVYAKSLLDQGSRDLIIQHYTEHKKDCMILHYGTSYIPDSLKSRWNTRASTDPLQAVAKDMAAALVCSDSVDWALNEIPCVKEHHVGGNACTHCLLKMDKEEREEAIEAYNKLMGENHGE